MELSDNPVPTNRFTTVPAYDKSFGRMTNPHQLMHVLYWSSYIGRLD
ncbi:hypothetical protein NBRC13296_08345 [Paenibacillus chitinolyticus]